MPSDLINTFLNAGRGASDIAVGSFRVSLSDAGFEVEVATMTEVCPTGSTGYGFSMTNERDVHPNPEKPIDEWVTGDEPMTGPQASYLATLAHEAGEEVPTDLSKAAASEMIDRLQRVTGRGAETSTGNATSNQEMS